MFSHHNALITYLEQNPHKMVSDYFMFRPIDINLFINEVNRKHWDNVKLLLDRGFYLLWPDEELRYTALKLLAMRANEPALFFILNDMLTRLNISDKANAFDSVQFQSLLAEVLQGAFLCDKEKSARWIIDRIKIEYGIRQHAATQNDIRPTFLNFQKKLSAYERSPSFLTYDDTLASGLDMIKHSLLGGHYQSATNICISLCDRHKTEKFDIISHFMTSAARYCNAFQLKKIAALFMKNNKHYQFLGHGNKFDIAQCAAAASAGMTKKVMKLIHACDIETKLAMISHALCAAALYGYGRLSLDLCDLLIKSHYPAMDIFDVISQSATCAMSHHYYALARQLHYQTIKFRIENKNNFDQSVLNFTLTARQELLNNINNINMLIEFATVADIHSPYSISWTKVSLLQWLNAKYDCPDIEPDLLLNLLTHHLGLLQFLMLARHTQDYATKMRTPIPIIRQITLAHLTRNIEPAQLDALINHIHQPSTSSKPLLYPRLFIAPTVARNTATSVRMFRELRQDTIEWIEHQPTSFRMHNALKEIKAARSLEELQQLTNKHNTSVIRFI